MRRFIKTFTVKRHVQFSVIQDGDKSWFEVRRWDAADIAPVLVIAFSYEPLNSFERDKARSKAIGVAIDRQKKAEFALNQLSDNAPKSWRAAERFEVLSEVDRRAAARANRAVPEPASRRRWTEEEDKVFNRIAEARVQAGGDRALSEEEERELDAIAERRMKEMLAEFEAKEMTPEEEAALDEWASKVAHIISLADQRQGIGGQLPVEERAERREASADLTEEEASEMDERAAALVQKAASPEAAAKDAPRRP